MVATCCIVGCHSRAEKGAGNRFFRFLLIDSERCGKWVTAVRRKNWRPMKHTRICGKHFVSGKKSSIHVRSFGLELTVFTHIYYILKL